MQVTDEMVERAAKALERYTTSSYEWSDEQFEIWWSRDSYFVTTETSWGALHWHTQGLLAAQDATCTGGSAPIILVDQKPSPV